MEDIFGLVGHTLKNTFVVEAWIGAGGFGVVYRGRHLMLDKQVAIKVLRVSEKASDAVRTEVSQKFLAEARLIAKLKHPSIVDVLDFGANTMPAGQVAPWMALEWIEGQTLKAWLMERQGRPVPPPEALAMLRPIFQGVALAHENNVAHRDIKPENIMVLASGRSTPPGTPPPTPVTKLLDFGIAKVMGPEESDTPSEHSKTVSMMVFASRYYAAPEQCNEGRTGPWTDVHALGLVLTELLTGSRAYQGNTPQSLLDEVLAVKRPTPTTLGVNIGPWEQVLAKAMAKVSAERYRNAGEFLAALEARVPKEAKYSKQRPSVAELHKTAPSGQVTGPTSAPSSWSGSAGASGSQPQTHRAKVVAGVFGALAFLVAIAIAVALGRRPDAPAIPSPTPHPPPVRDAAVLRSEPGDAGATPDVAPPPVDRANASVDAPLDAVEEEAAPSRPPTVRPVPHRERCIYTADGILLNPNCRDRGR